MADRGKISGKGAGSGNRAGAPRRAAKTPAAPAKSARVGADPAVAAAKSGRAGKNVAVTTGGAILSARISGEELQAFDALVAELGYRSRSDALRAMIRVGSGFLEFRPEEAEALAELQHELHKIGVNVNQIALAANRRRVALVQAQWQDLNELRAALPAVRGLLKQINDEHRRRGMALFRPPSGEAAHG
ncbi:CopG family ribbon-helix-helix protein [Tabrizicola oligotrophica]|uniref:Ribbon-helix-helix protein, CopG family n=1 Tax=Tabrizicola oligotrophica TaxID=2710650 RepID=A0A6M0QX96_9RHOB|nr:plasmid mobilization relaxosome protein MobC [Tabrizicola oligotrophica]NEY92007.1 ribbon-helix-helix protein, CopG family [Tabrizicola oligotrophica]